MKAFPTPPVRRPGSGRRVAASGRASLLRAVAAAFLLGACGKERTGAGEDGLRPFVVQLDWFPEPEHGGLYQALARGYFAEEGLDVTLLPGGTNANVLRAAATGRADVVQYASNLVAIAVAEGADLVNIASVFHRMPLALLMHEENPVDSFEDLDGKRIKARLDSGFVPYLQRTYGIDFEVIPTDFAFGAFLADKDYIQMGFSIAEPYYLEKQGARVKWLTIADSGYTNAMTLVATRATVEERREDLRGFLRAYVRGWREYLEGDPEPAHALIRRANPDVTDGFLAFSRGRILEERLVRGDPALGEGIGTLSLEQVRREIRQLEEIGLLDPGAVRAEDIVDTSLLPREPAPGVTPPSP